MACECFSSLLVCFWPEFGPFGPKIVSLSDYLSNLSGRKTIDMKRRGREKNRNVVVVVVEGKE